MERKRILSLILLLALLLTATACGEAQSGVITNTGEPTVLTLWVYPMGDWQNKSMVNALLHGFADTRPDVTVAVTYLSEDTADSDVSAAIECGECPDLLLGSLSQLQHAQRRGALAMDLGGLCKSGVYPAVKTACTDSDGLFYALPAVMDVTCMAINYEMFRNADALQYIDESCHSWTTESFFKAVKALQKLDQSPDVLALYCGGQNGDEGTRALVTNLYGGSFTNEAHSRYSLDSEENITALTELQKQPGVIFDENIVAQDENILFAQEQLAMSLYWGSGNELPDKFTAFPMAYPTPEGDARMPGEVWGFSCFDNGNEDTLEAAKALLTYLTDQDAVYGKLVKLCGHYGVRKYSGAVADDFSAFMPMMGSYDLSTPGFAIARGEWYELLQRLGSGADVAVEIETFCTNTNAAARETE